FMFNAVQSNTISQSFMDVFGLPDWIIVLVLVIFTAIIIFGGVKRIVRVTELVVPIMAVFYLIIAFYILITNISQIPEVFNLIIGQAFGLKEVVGGGVGAALMEGIRRGQSGRA